MGFREAVSSGEIAAPADTIERLVGDPEADAVVPHRYRWLRVSVAASVLALFCAAALLPSHWITSRARYEGDSSEPIYDVPIDHRALRSAAEILHRSGGTYYVHVPPRAPVLRGNVNAALRLWATPAVPLAYAADPDWVLSYRTERTGPAVCVMEWESRRPPGRSPQKL